MKTAEAISPTRRTTSDQGTFGTNLEPSIKIASAPKPIAAVSGLVSSSPKASAWMRPSTSVALTGMPVRLGSSPMITSTVRPSTNPVTMGFDKNSAIQPIRTCAAMINTMPAATATAVV